MKHMNQTVFALVALLSLALLLAGCGQTSSTSTAEQPASQEQTTQETTMPETTTETPAAETTMPETTTETPAAETTSMETSTEASSETTSLSSESIEVAGCTDSDGGKVYDVKGTLVDSHAVTDMDRCSTNENYPGRLYESYCGEDGKRGRETYDCPSGSCMDGACVAAESSSDTMTE